MSDDEICKSARAARSQERRYRGFVALDPEYKLKAFHIKHDLIEKREPEYLGYTSLHFAVSTMKKDLVESLLSHGADVTRKDGNGYTPLRILIKDRDSIEYVTTRYQSLLDLLLSAHIKSNNATNPSCKDGISHLHIACLADNVPVARLFLKAGVSVNQKIKDTSRLFPGWTPLHFAVSYGTEELVKLLLTHGADLNFVDGNGFTPLRLLVEYKIEINRSRDDDTEVKFKLLRIDTLIDFFINTFTSVARKKTQLWLKDSWSLVHTSISELRMCSVYCIVYGTSGLRISKTRVLAFLARTQRLSAKIESFDNNSPAFFQLTYFAKNHRALIIGFSNRIVNRTVFKNIQNL